MRRHFFLIGFASSVVLLLAVGYLGYRSYAAYREAVGLVEHSYRVKSQIDRITSLTKSASLRLKESIIAGENTNLSGLERMENARLRQFRLLDSLVSDNPVQLENDRLLLGLLEKHEVVSRRLLPATIGEKEAGSSLTRLLEEEEAVLDSISMMAEKMKNEENRLLQIRREQVEQASFTPFTRVTLIALVLAITAALYFTISALLRKNERAAQELRARLSDLNKEFEKRTLTEELLRSVLHSSPNGILAFRSVRNHLQQIVDFECILANNLSPAISQLPERELPGKSLLDALPGICENELFNQYVQVVETSETLKTEKYFYNGEDEAWFDISAVKRGDGLVITFNDITLIKKHEKEMVRKSMELEKSNEDLEYFAYIASHDLQEPLRKIRAFGDRLVRSYQALLDEKGRDFIARMGNAAQRMDVLINDLLKFSRISRAEPQFVSVNLNKVLSDVCEDLELIFPKSRAKIHYRDLPEICGDPVQLHQLFQNLISNAIKYAKKDESPVVIVDAECVDTGRRAIPRDGCLRWKIRVQDNGIGFDPKYRDQIFIIFQRLHGRTEYSGTGIGLAICQKIVFNHGGSIEADSVPGEGSVFTIHLPTNGQTYGTVESNHHLNGR